MFTIQTETIRLLIVSCFISFMAPVNALASAHASSPAEINYKADEVLASATDQIPEAGQLIQDAPGVLIFPSITKDGTDPEIEYGQGVLRTGDKAVGYYFAEAASLGIQVGAQKKALILIFTNETALQSFRDQDAWTAGENGEIAVLKHAVTMPETDTLPPILAILLEHSGPVYNFSLLGSRFIKSQL